MATVSLIRVDNAVYVNGLSGYVDLSSMSPNIHAVQWDSDNSVGHVEYVGAKYPNLELTDFTEYQQYWDEWSTLYGNAPANPVATHVVSYLELMNLFSAAEQEAIATLAQTDYEILLWMTAAAGAQYIDMADPRTIAGLNLLVSKGLIEAERVAEILGGATWNVATGCTVTVIPAIVSGTQTGKASDDPSRKLDCLFTVANGITDRGQYAYALAPSGSVSVLTTAFAGGAARAMMGATLNIIAVENDLDWRFDGRFRIEADIMWKGGIAPSAPRDAMIVAHYLPDGNNRGWGLKVNADGHFEFGGSIDGTQNWTTPSVGTTVAALNTRYRVRVDRPSLGAAISIYLWNEASQTWVQEGTQSVQSFFNPACQLTLFTTDGHASPAAANSDCHLRSLRIWSGEDARIVSPKPVIIGGAGSAA
jgi:hypothetical protein